MGHPTMMIVRLPCCSSADKVALCRSADLVGMAVISPLFLRSTFTLIRLDGSRHDLRLIALQVGDDAMIRPTAQQLILDVMDGNPGAFTMIRTLTQHPLWRPLLRYLRTQGLVGSVLWSTIKDDYGGDARRFSQDQIAVMAQHELDASTAHWVESKVRAPTTQG